MCINGGNNVGDSEELTANEMYEEVRDEGRNDTISEETRDYVMSTAYSTDKVLSGPTDEDNITKDEWAQEIRSEGADNTISQESLDYVRESFNKVGKDL